MSGHHGGSRQAIGHAWSHLVDTVTTGRVAHQVDSVGVDIFEDDQILDQAVKQRVDVSLVPEIPRVGGRPWGEVNPLGGLVESLLVVPLLIDLDRVQRIASSVVWVLSLRI